MKLGSGTQWCVHRPSAARKNPFGARGSVTHVWKLGVSGRSTRCHGPTVVASTPWSNDVWTCCPRPVTSRARSAALIARVAL